MKNTLQQISSWEELAKVPDSETHYIEIDDGIGWIYSKTNDDDFHYLNTHTFYNNTSRLNVTKELQARGFNIELVKPKWDNDDYLTLYL